MLLAGQQKIYLWVKFYFSLSNGNKLTNGFCLLTYIMLVVSTNQMSYRRTWMQSASWKTRIPAVAEVGQPYPLYLKASIRLRVTERINDFPEWMQSHTLYGDRVKSNARINSRARYGNSAHVSNGCRQKHCIQNCGQTDADKNTHVVTFGSLYKYFINHSSIHHRSIQRYYRRTLLSTV